MTMLLDDLIAVYRASSRTARDIIYQDQGRTLSSESAKELRANIEADEDMTNQMRSAVRYLLDVKQVERFRGVRVKGRSYPPLIHETMFVEFNGILEFQFRPWSRPDAFTIPDPTNPHIRPLSPDPDCGPTSRYRGVLIHRYQPPHHYVGWPDEPVIRVWWYEKPIPKAEYTIAHNYTLTLTPSWWPRRMDVYGATEKDEAQHPGEQRHGERMLAMTANLLYFLAAENVVKVRIAPEHHLQYGKDLRGLPKSDTPYYVTPFQLPRYRYLHPPEPGASGRHVNVCFDVRGFIRQLTHERYSRHPDGSVRTVWVQPHQRGLGHEYRPAIRIGAIDSMYLDYDKFMRAEAQRMKKAARRAA